MHLLLKSAFNAVAYHMINGEENELELKFQEVYQSIRATMEQHTGEENCIEAKSLMENFLQYPEMDDVEGEPQPFPADFWKAFWAEQKVIGAFTKQVQNRIEVGDKEIMDLRTMVEKCSVTSTVGGTYTVSKATIGGKVWTDRDYPFFELPNYLVNKILYQVPHRIPNNGVVTLTAPVEGHFYVLTSQGREDIYAGRLAPRRNPQWTLQDEHARWGHNMEDTNGPVFDIYKSGPCSEITLPIFSPSVSSMVFMFVPTVPSLPFSDRQIMASIFGPVLHGGAYFLDTNVKLQ